MKTAFKNISDMNIAYGHEFGSVVTEEKGIKRILKEKISKLFNQVSNLTDEAEELKVDAFNVLLKDPHSKSGRKEMFDAIGDLLVFAHGAGHLLGEDITDINRLDRRGEPLLGVEIKELLSDKFKDELMEKIKDSQSIENVEKQELVDMYEFISSINKDQKKFYEIFYQMLIKSIESFKKAVKDANFEECLNNYDEINDLLIFLFEINAKPGYTVDLLIDRITESNLSKICKDQTEVDSTVKYYNDKGVEVYVKNSLLNQENGKPFILVCSTKEQTIKEFNQNTNSYEDKVFRKDKVLKNVNWFEPELSDF